MCEIRWLEKIFNNCDTSCQGESEFVNHSMAASKSGKKLDPSPDGEFGEPFMAAEKGMNRCGYY